MSEELLNCPECGDACRLHLKLEAGYAKYHFSCLNITTCGWESRTFRGPHRTEAEIDEIGYDRHVAKIREDARTEARGLTASDLI